MLSQRDVLELVTERLYPLWREEKAKLDRVDDWLRWEHERLKLPLRASQEHKWLADLSKSPWLGLVVTTVAQALYVDGYRSPDQTENATAWRIWEANDFDWRQVAVHRSALAYGSAYVTVLPGEDAVGVRTVLRGISARRMIAVYREPADDEWPIFALGVTDQTDGYLLRVYDDEAVYFVSIGRGGSDPEFIESREHGAGVCPVVRYCNLLDLDGRTEGEVEPLIPLAARIDKTTYDRLLTQHFNSWKVRTIAGIDIESSVTATTNDGSEPTQADIDAAKVKLRQEDILTAQDADTKFGTLDETPLDGFVRAHDSDIETLAAIGQVPTTSLTGKVANLSAEAIAELRSGLTQKCTERQKSFGKAHAQALRLGAYLEGDAAAAEDFRSRVTWQDMQIRSLSQAADALGKIATLLQVPPQELWSRIPGVEKADVDEWRASAAEGDAFAGLSTLLQQQAAPPAAPPNGVPLP